MWEGSSPAVGWLTRRWCRLMRMVAQLNQVAFSLNQGCAKMLAVRSSNALLPAVRAGCVGLLAKGMAAAATTGTPQLMKGAVGLLGRSKARAVLAARCPPLSPPGAPIAAAPPTSPSLSCCPRAPVAADVTGYGEGATTLISKEKYRWESKHDATALVALMAVSALVGPGLPS